MALNNKSINDNIQDNIQSESPIFYKGDKEIPGIQILKVFCAFLVVLIHEPSFLKGYIMPLTRIAVPIFFMITGYFILDSYGNLSEKKLKKTLYKITRLYIIVAFVYIIYKLLIYIRHPELYSTVFLNYRYWIHFLFTGTKPTGHLWYLIALIQALVIIIVAIKLKVERMLFFIIPIGLVLNLIIGRYNFIFDDFNIPNNLILSRNVLTIGLPCILIGMMIRRYEHFLPSCKTIIILSFFTLCAIYVETIILRVSFHSLQGDIILFTIPFAICVFILFLKYQSKHPIAHSLAKIGKLYSMDIYIWHILVAGFVLFALKKCGLTGMGALIVAGITLILAIILRRTNLKRFYS